MKSQYAVNSGLSLFALKKDTVFGSMFLFCETELRLSQLKIWIDLYINTATNTPLLLGIESFPFFILNFWQVPCLSSPTHVDKIRHHAGQRLEYAGYVRTPRVSHGSIHLGWGDTWKRSWRSSVYLCTKHGGGVCDDEWLLGDKLHRQRSLLQRQMDVKRLSGMASRCRTSVIWCIFTLEMRQVLCS